MGLFFTARLSENPGERTEIAIPPTLEIEPRPPIDTVGEQFI